MIRRVGARSEFWDQYRLYLFLSTGTFLLSLSLNTLSIFTSGGCINVFWFSSVLDLATSTVYIYRSSTPLTLFDVLLSYSDSESSLLPLTALLLTYLLSRVIVCLLVLIYLLTTLGFIALSLNFFLLTVPIEEETTFLKDFHFSLVCVIQPYTFLFG